MGELLFAHEARRITKQNRSYNLRYFKDAVIEAVETAIGNGEYTTSVYIGSLTLLEREELEKWVRNSGYSTKYSNKFGYLDISWFRRE